LTSSRRQQQKRRRRRRRPTVIFVREIYMMSLITGKQFWISNEWQRKHPLHQGYKAKICGFYNGSSAVFLNAPLLRMASPAASPLHPVCGACPCCARSSSLPSRLSIAVVRVKCSCAPAAESSSIALWAVVCRELSPFLCPQCSSNAPKHHRGLPAHQRHHPPSCTRQQSLQPSHPLLRKKHPSLPVLCSPLPVLRRRPPCLRSVSHSRGCALSAKCATLQQLVTTSLAAKCCSKSCRWCSLHKQRNAGR
jgi:hypothetical protein